MLKTTYTPCEDCDDAHKEVWAYLNENPQAFAKANKILRRFAGDIDPTFLGFLGTYFHLRSIFQTRSELFPTTIYDLGCGYGFQSILFAKYCYVGVDTGAINERFVVDHHEHHKMDIGAFCESIKGKLPQHSFAILNYVPCDSKTTKLVKTTFNNCYTYYPEPVNLAVRSPKTN